MVLLAVVIVVAVVGNEFVVCDVDCECSECDAEAGEGALEAVATAEGTGVPPGLTTLYQYPMLLYSRRVPGKVDSRRTLLPMGRLQVGRRLRRTFAGRNR